MKKYIIMLFCAIAALNISAQETTQKKYLPEQGDIAIGVDVTPVLRYVGNAFNGSTDNSLNGLSGTPFNDRMRFITPSASIMMKYMLTDEIALRTNLGLLFNNYNDRRYTVDDKDLAINPLSEKKLIDSKLTKRKGFSWSVGAEYRKGTKRIQGIFGLSALVAFQKESTSYTYGNAITSVNQIPSNAFGITDNYRPLKEWNQAGESILGLSGTVGLEWFVAPKIALGTEVSLSLYGLFGKQNYTESEGYNVSLEKVETRTDINSPGDKGFYCGTETLGGSLYMIFYF